MESQETEINSLENKVRTLKSDVSNLKLLRDDLMKSKSISGFLSNENTEHIDKESMDL